jgi:hypothetical protein
LLVVVAAAAAGWFLLRRPEPEPAGKPEPRATARPSARRTPAASPTPLADRGPRVERGPTATPAPATAPVLRVDSDVAGANVFLDHRFLGTTPVETRDFAPGPHRLNVSAEGYEMHGEHIEIGPEGRDVMVRFKEVRLDEAVDVVHKHGMGSCRGRLSATTAGLRYETDNKGDAFSAPFASLEPLSVDYLKKNLRVKVKGGKTWNFTADGADALLAFQKKVEQARSRL